jgi:hypothetical protein
MKVSEKTDLLQIKYYLDKAINYLGKDEIVILNLKFKTALPEYTYINKGTGEVATVINKSIGSELIYFHNALRYVNSMLHPENEF